MSGPVFETLGELSEFVTERGIEVVDPGMPLESVVTARGDLWASQPSVRKVTGFIARNVASIPLHVYERVSDADRRRVTNHPLARLMKAPAPRTSSARFWELVIIDWLLHDRWCVMRVPLPDGGTELVRLPHRLWRFKADALDRPVAIQTRKDGRWVDHSLDNFIFDHGYSRVGANGTSPAVTLRDLLAESAEAVAYRRAIWKNGARVPAVLKRPANAPWSDDSRKRFTRSWQNFVRGGGREGGTPVLEDGMELVKVDAFNPKDTEDLAGRKLTDIEVATAYYIAPELLGIREGTYSNVESHRQALYRDALGPYIDAWVGAINAQLTPDLSEGRDLYVEAHVEAKLRGSFEEQARILQSAVGAPWMVRSEARARMNLPEIPGTDELIVPLNVIEGGLASPRDTAPKAHSPRVKALEPDLAPVDRERAALESTLAGYHAALADHLLGQFDLKNSADLTEAFDLEARNSELAAIIAGRQRRIAQVAASEVLDEWNPERDGWDPDVMDPWLDKAAAAKAELANQGIYERLAEAMVAEDWRSAVLAELEDPNWAALWAVTVATSAASFGRNDAAQASGLTTKTWRTRSPDPRPAHAALNGVTIPIGSIFAVGGRWPGDPFMPPEQNANCRCVLEYGRGG